MGYDFIIGEKKIIEEADYRRVWAEGESHDSAPAFGEPTDYTNERWPSYTAWIDFCTATGLYDIFYMHKKSLIPDHPGWQTITPRHQTVIGAAYKNFKYNNPDAVLHMGYSTESGYLCRLVWLKYWIDWALENCEHPVFCNS